MTIKRRLALSNILMILIPTVITLFIALGTLRITWYWVEQVWHKYKSDDFSYDEASKLAINTLETGISSSKLDSLLSDSKTNMIVYDPAGKQHSFGKETFAYADLMLSDLDHIGGTGYINIENEELYAITVNPDQAAYKIIFLMQYDIKSEADYYNALTTRFIIVVAVTMISVVSAIIITNRILTRFVFDKIKHSLDLLADSVHAIRDGNLEYRIIYDRNDEFTPVCEDFNNMAESLQLSSELILKQEQNRKELLVGISHDLRSPLTSIKAYVEGLLDGVAKTPLAQKNYMQMIKTKAEDIDHMVSELFLFSKMDMGEYPYNPERLNLAQELSSYASATSEEYLSKGLVILQSVMPPKCIVIADPLQLRRILSNILENSLKYKDNEQVTVTIELEEQVSLARILISDDGPGVPSEALDKLFDVFFRLDSSRNKPSKGSGLGLAICAKAVSLMNGQIYAECNEPRGLRIIIELPVTTKE